METGSSEDLFCVDLPIILTPSVALKRCKPREERAQASKRARASSIRVLGATRKYRQLGSHESHHNHSAERVFFVPSTTPAPLDN